MRRLAIRWTGFFRPERGHAANAAKRISGQSLENKQFREIPDSVVVMISKAYDLPCETFRFRIAKYPLRFRGSWGSSAHEPKSTGQAFEGASATRGWKLPKWAKEQSSRWNRWRA
jgi:hypothetical protein